MHRLLLALAVLLLWSVPASAQFAPIFVDFTRLLGAEPSATNPLPTRPTDGTDFIVFPTPITADFDTSGGTATREAIGLAVPASGGPVIVPGSATLGLAVQNTVPVFGANSLPLILCNQRVIIDGLTADTILITGTGGQHIYVCSYVLTAEGTVDAGLTSGTGTACATSGAKITGTFAFSTTTGFLGIARGAGMGMVTRSEDTGDDVCLDVSAGVVVNGEVTYTKF